MMSILQMKILKLRVVCSITKCETAPPWPQNKNERWSLMISKACFAVHLRSPRWGSSLLTTFLQPTAQKHWGTRQPTSGLWMSQATNPWHVTHRTSRMCTCGPWRDGKDSHACAEDSWNFPLPLHQAFLSLDTLLFPTSSICTPLKKLIGDTDLSFASCLLAWPPCNKASSLCKRLLPQCLVFLLYSGPWAHLFSYKWTSGHVNPGSLIPGLGISSGRVRASSQQCLWGASVGLGRGGGLLLWHAWVAGL